MQKISKCVLLLFGLLIFSNARAQNKEVDYPDSLIVKTDDNQEIAFAFSDIRKGRPTLDDTTWKSVLGAMKSSLDAASQSEGVLVTYRKVKVNGEDKAKIQVDAFDSSSDVFLIGNDQMRHYSADRVEFRIEYPSVSVFFSLNDADEVEQLKEVSVEDVWNKVEKNRENMKTNRVIYSGKGTINYGVFSIKEINHADRRESIELSAGVGLGYYRDQFIPDLNYNVAFLFDDRFGNLKYKFGLLYNQQYVLNRVSEGEYDLNLNGFLSGYWVKHFNNDRAYGLGFGYLIHKQGSFYKGDTFKMSIYTRGGSRASITPELIFTDGFKQSFPAIRFGLTF